MSNEGGYTVFYKYRYKTQMAALRNLKAAFEFVDDMENESGGFAEEISNATERYTRLVDHTEGKAYWINFGTGEKFVEYRG